MHTLEFNPNAFHPYIPISNINHIQERRGKNTPLIHFIQRRQQRRWRCEGWGWGTISRWSGCTGHGMDNGGWAWWWSRQKKRFRWQMVSKECVEGQDRGRGRKIRFAGWLLTMKSNRKKKERKEISVIKEKRKERMKKRIKETTKYIIYVEV